MRSSKPKTIEEIMKATEGCQLPTANERAGMEAVLSCMDRDGQIDKVLLMEKYELESVTDAEDIIAAVAAICEEKTEELLTGDYPRKMGEEAEDELGR